MYSGLVNAFDIVAKDNTHTHTHAYVGEGIWAIFYVSEKLLVLVSL